MPRHPSAPREFTVVVDDGALLRVWDHPGRPGTGVPTLVLAHGWTLTHDSWLPVVERVRAATGARVLTYDQRGHGRSTPGSSATTVRALGDDLASVLAVAVPEGPLVLGGHSMGGMTVMAYAGLHPEALRDRVRGVALVSTACGDLAGGRSRLEGIGLRALSRGPRVPAGRFVTQRGQRRLLFGSNADAEAVRLTRDQVASTTLPTLGRFYAAFDAHDETAALAGLEGIPTAVLVGERDRLTPPRHSRRLGELVPHADVQVLDGLGHMLTYEAPDVVAGAIEALLFADESEERSATG